MLDVVRQYVDAALGALPKDKAMDLASGLLEQGQAGREGVTKLANDLMEWSRASVERLSDMVRSEVRKQVGALGLATREDVDEIKERLWKLEGAAGAAPASRKVPAKKRPAAKRRPAKRAAAMMPDGSP
jgi:polyhydroxyalkanoate synthesis regulator phasin